jgi:NAD(P)-dependent dehydrogenase (short-subunit alcohol dehydrogenase family)
MERSIVIRKNEKLNLNINNGFALMPDIISFKGKRALISGAASGIGRAISMRLAEAGSDLILLDIDENGLKDIKDAAESYGVQVDTFITDLAKKESIDSFWEDITGELPDIIINNAGIYPFKDYLEVDKSFYENTLEINLHSVFWMCQNFIRKRGSKGGIIVNISSIEAMIPFKEDLAHYSISKAGVMALTRSLAKDYGKKGFRVNCILPGAIRTPGTESLVKKAITKMQFHLVRTGIHFNARLTLGRWGKPDEVAKVILFLASDMASYVQGTMIPVDGGFLSC